MKINQVLETNEINEGPLWDKVKQAGSSIGKGAVRAAKAVGKAAPGVINKVGDIAGAAAGGIGNIGGSLVGGARRGYNTQTGQYSQQYSGSKGQQPGVAQGEQPQNTQDLQNQIQQKQQEIQALQAKLDAAKQPATAEPVATAPAQNNAPETTAKTGPTTGQEVSMSGKTYRFLGQQWAEVNPQTGKTGRVAEKGIVAGLNQLAAQSTPTTGKPDLRVVQGGQSQQAAENYKFESKFLGMMI